MRAAVKSRSTPASRGVGVDEAGAVEQRAIWPFPKIMSRVKRFIPASVRQGFSIRWISWRECAAASTRVGSTQQSSPQTCRPRDIAPEKSLGDRDQSRGEAIGAMWMDGTMRLGSR